MAYNYFSQQLLKSNLDLSSVFPVVQEEARNQENLAYGLPEIVEYIKTATNDFKKSDGQMIDLDSGIRDVIEKYYKSVGQTNPFEKSAILIPTFAVESKGSVPRKGLRVDVPAKEADEVEETELKEVKVIEQPLEQKAEDVLQAKIESFKKELAGRQFLIDESDPEEKEDIMNKQKERFVGYELQIDTGEADELEKAKYQLLKEFIEKNS